jgi:protection of telomeres protein 1
MSKVRAANPEVQLSTADEIVNNPARKVKKPNGEEFVLPFVNAKYRTRVRVVDFSPEDLTDFSKSITDSAWNNMFENMAFEHRHSEDRWEWFFPLLVEDAVIPAGTAPVRFPLFVTNDAGQHLLKMDATE